MSTIAIVNISTTTAQMAMLPDSGVPGSMPNTPMRHSSSESSSPAMATFLTVLNLIPRPPQDMSARSRY